MVPVPLRRPVAWVEFFVLVNLAVLTADITLAHSVNAFADPFEWVPLAASLAAPPLLLFAHWRSGPHRPDRRPSRGVGLAVGWVCVAVGVGGMLLHLESRFFVERTLASLVYAAPFVAPLAYTGLGLLLLLDRTVDAGSVDWARWIVFLALGGFVGNFGLSLADHAQNAFFDAREWIPVASAAFACSFLLVTLVRPHDARLARVTALVMALQVVVGLAGFAWHAATILEAGDAPLWRRVVHGAPVFAPLLFPNLALLAAIGLVALSRSRAPRSTGTDAATAPAR